MADIYWPSGLSLLVDQDSFTYDFGSTVIRSSNSNGPDKVRRIMTKGTDVMKFSMTVTSVQYSTIETFYKVTTNGGVYQFYFTHPVTQLQISLRFTKPPSFAPIGGLVFKVSFETEILPQ